MNTQKWELQEREESTSNLPEEGQAKKRLRVVTV
jgi:hypothetical protein